MKLKAYLDKYDESQSAFARRIGVKQQAISQIVAGGGCHTNTADAIIDGTGGLVTLKDLTRPGPTRRQKSQAA